MDSVHPDNSAGVAMLLAIAKFCRENKYWAKDIVFLITDNEQLGTQVRNFNLLISWFLGKCRYIEFFYQEISERHQK